VSQIRKPTRNFLNAIAYGQKIDQSLRILVVAVVFTNVRKLRVGARQLMVVPRHFTVLSYPRQFGMVSCQGCLFTPEIFVCVSMLGSGMMDLLTSAQRLGLS